MNPFDHPHGGGEDKGRRKHIFLSQHFISNCLLLAGRPSVSYSGVLAKGFKTRFLAFLTPAFYHVLC